MIKALALAFTIAAVPVVMAAPPAKAYDPCVRATEAYQRAVAARDAARTCSAGVCFTPMWAASKVYETRVRMNDACRG